MSSASVPHALPELLIELCEQVCGDVRRQLQALDAILQPA
jgi:hypothetical protein